MSFQYSRYLDHYVQLNVMKSGANKEYSAIPISRRVYVSFGSSNKAKLLGYHFHARDF